MKTKKRKRQKMHIGEDDYLLACRRATRSIEIETHGRPVRFRTTVVHSTKKVYSRNRMKRQAIKEGLPLYFGDLFMGNYIFVDPESNKSC